MARGKIQGWVEQGGHTTLTDGRVSTDKVQQSFPLASVEVFNAGTAVQATIFSDEGGTPKANPFTSDSTGFWFFWADQGRYDVKFSGAGIPTPFTIFSLETIIAAGLVDPGSNGFLARTAPNVLVARTFLGTTSEIIVTNGVGGGNPVISLDVNLNFSGKTITGGTFVSPIIGNFQNAIHNHENAVGGGQLNASNVFSAGTVPVARLPIMVGATGVSNGVAGLVTQPLIGDENKFLRGDGSWQVTGGGGGTPGSPSLSVQYNNAGAFGGISGVSSDGTNMTAGSGNLRATRPRFITSIDDTNGNELFGISSVGSAVNEFTVANAATGGHPVISATGLDANINMVLTPKGSGIISTAGNVQVSNNAPQITLIDVNDSKTVRINLSGSNWDFTNDTLGTVPIRINTTNNLVTLVGDLNISKNTPEVRLIDTVGSTRDAQLQLSNDIFSLGNGISALFTTDLVNGPTNFLFIPTGPASDPTTDNQLVRKKYVDDRIVTFSLPFRIDDPSSFPVGDESAAIAVRIPPIIGGFLTKITIIRVGGSHTGGTSVTFQARILNNSNIGSGVQFNDTNSANLTVYTEDFVDVAISEGQYVTIIISARSGTVAERNVNIAVEGFRKVS